MGLLGFGKKDENVPPEVGEEDAFEKAKAAREGNQEVPSNGKEDVINKIKKSAGIETNSPENGSNKNLANEMLGEFTQPIDNKEVITEAEGQNG